MSEAMQRMVSRAIGRSWIYATRSESIGDWQRFYYDVPRPTSIATIRMPIRRGLIRVIDYNGDLVITEEDVISYSEHVDHEGYWTWRIAGDRCIGPGLFVFMYCETE